MAQTLRARAAGLRAYKDVYETMRPKREREGETVGHAINMNTVPEDAAGKLVGIDVEGNFVRVI